MTWDADAVHALVGDAGGDRIEIGTLRIVATENHRRTELGARGLILRIAAWIDAAALQAFGELLRTSSRRTRHSRRQAILREVHAKHFSAGMVNLHAPLAYNLAIAIDKMDSHGVHAVSEVRERRNRTARLESVTKLNRKAYRCSAVLSRSRSRKNFGDDRDELKRV